MRSKILKHYKEEFSSSPIEVSDEEIDFIIANKCICDKCGKSVFEMEDFPELSIEDNELLCEYCYDSEYRQPCPICENYFDTKDTTPDHIIINEELSRETGQPAGIYKIMKRPFFFGNILSGFDGFLTGNIKLVTRIDINKYKEIECGQSYCEVYSDFICPDCVTKFTENKRYADIVGRPCIFFRRFDDTLFKEYSPETLKKIRSKMIHERITCRGIIEKSRT